MHQTTLTRCIAHCDRAIEGLRLAWLDGDAQYKARTEAVALKLHETRMALIAYAREHQQDDQWDTALAQLVKEHAS